MLATLRQRNFALLWFSGLISLAGDYVLYIALPLYVYNLTGSVLATSAMLIARLAPAILLGTLAGVFVDRWDRKRTLIVANLLLAVTLLPLLIVRSVESVWLVYLVAVVSSTLAQFVGPAENALLPLLVGEELLVPANALNSLNNNLARLVGAALGGILFGLFGLTGVVLIDAATFLIAAGLVALIDMAKARAAVAAEREFSARRWLALWREWREGLRLIGRDRTLATLFAMVAITSVGEGIMSALFVVFVGAVLHAGALELGWLMSAQGAGGLLGGVVVGALGNRFAPARMVGVCAVLFGAIDLAIFNYPLFIPGVALGIALFALVGIPAVGMGTAENTLLQTVVADAYRGRIFGAIGATQGLLMLVGALTGGLLGERLGVVTMLNIQGGGYIVAGLLALLLLNPSPYRMDVTPSEAEAL
jgi:MFS family permease